MKKLLFIIAFSFLQAEQYHPQDEMENFECYAEYGMNCEEAEEYEQDQYEEEQEEQEQEEEEE